MFAIQLAAMVLGIASPASPASDMVCTDTKGANGAVLMSSCQLTRLVPDDVPELRARASHHLAVEIRTTATQADFDTIAGAPFLTYVVAYSPQITRLDALATFQHLQTLGIQLDAFTSMSALSDLPIQALTISGPGRIENLAPIAALSSLETLDIGGGPDITLAHLDGVEQLPALKNLVIYARIEDGSALAGTHLASLSLMNGTIPFAAIRSLAIDTLAIAMNTPTPEDVASLEAMPMLRTLKSLDLWIDRIPTFPAMPALESLRINLFNADGRFHRDVDLSFAKRAAAMRYVSIGGARSVDITPLLALRKLESVDLQHVCHADLHRLDALPKLHYVMFSRSLQPALRPKRRDLYIVETDTMFACPDVPPRAPPASLAT